MGIVVGEHELLVSATAAELPPAVAAAVTVTRLEDSPPGETGVVSADGVEWATRTWGPPSDPPLLLVHGVTSDTGTFWRLGPALAAAGWRAVAIDLPGHGATRPWRGHHRLAETAAELASFVEAAGLAVPELAVLGHSWGGMVVARLPGAGIRPRTLILLDPPHLTLDELRALTEEGSEQLYPSVDEAREAVRADYPLWTEGDVDAKAIGLTRFSPEAVRAVLLENGPWDAGLAALEDPAAAAIPTWYIRGEWQTGGMIPDDAVARLAARVGRDHVLTIVGGSHSPHRMNPEATVFAILRALEASGPRLARA